MYHLINFKKFAGISSMLPNPQMCQYLLFCNVFTEILNLTVNYLANRHKLFGEFL